MKYLTLYLTYINYADNTEVEEVHAFITPKIYLIHSKIVWNASQELPPWWGRQRRIAVEVVVKLLILSSA